MPTRRARCIRWLRYLALCALSGCMFVYALHSYQWEVKRSVLAFAVPLGFIVNAVAFEILIRQLKKPPPGE